MRTPETHLSQLQLYDKYAPALFGIILKVCSDRQQAAEILKRAFSKIQMENDSPTSDFRPFTRLLRFILEDCECSLQLPKSELIAAIFPSLVITQCPPPLQA